MAELWINKCIRSYFFQPIAHVHQRTSQQVFSLPLFHTDFFGMFSVKSDTPYGIVGTGFGKLGILSKHDSVRIWLCCLLLQSRISLYPVLHFIHFVIFFLMVIDILPKVILSQPTVAIVLFIA